MWKLNVAAGIVPLLLAGVPYFMGERAKRHLVFDRSEWIESRDAWRHPTPRRRMVRDLVRYHLLPGLSREEVTRLLGEPSDSNREALRYSLDPEFMRGSDNYWNDLVVEFGEEGGLVRCEVEWN